MQGVPTPAAIRRLREGIKLEDGVTSPAEVSMPQDGLLRLVIHEGRNRQVRRMCEAVGHPVLWLGRGLIGPFSVSSLSAGVWRSMTRDEVRSLYEEAINS